MGGINQLDENVDHFRVGLRGMKWWSPFLHLELMTRGIE
jgi:hypothetical protein